MDKVENGIREWFKSGRLYKNLESQFCETRSDFNGDKMTILMKKFGTQLISPPERRDAALLIAHQFLDRNKENSVELDFDGVKVLTPSWLHEIIQEILKLFDKVCIQFINAENSSVKASIEMVSSIL